MPNRTNIFLNMMRGGLSVFSFLVSVSIYAFNYEFVPVGNPGNASDTTGVGAVNYDYQIGKYIVTIEQYTTFLNAVAKEDTYGLYNSEMETILAVAGINQTGTSPNYVYSVIDNGGSSAKRPVTNVNWFASARFANWMANGQPTGAQDATTTENGAYALNGKVSGSSVPKNTINPNTGAAPTHYIPSENEWYKAAYYSPNLNGGAGGYYSYATQSNTTPGNNIGNMPNQANWFSDELGFAVTQSITFVTTQNYLTDVGVFAASASFYGTFDQTGNVWEWTASLVVSTLSTLFGGGWYSNTPYITSEIRVLNAPQNRAFNAGFRLAGPA